MCALAPSGRPNCQHALPAPLRWSAARDRPTPDCARDSRAGRPLRGTARRHAPATRSRRPPRSRSPEDLARRSRQHCPRRHQVRGRITDAQAGKIDHAGNPPVLHEQVVRMQVAMHPDRSALPGRSFQRFLPGRHHLGLIELRDLADGLARALVPVGQRRSAHVVVRPAPWSAAGVDPLQRGHEPPEHIRRLAEIRDPAGGLFTGQPGVHSPAPRIAFARLAHPQRFGNAKRQQLQPWQPPMLFLNGSGRPGKARHPHRLVPAKPENRMLCS